MSDPVTNAEVEDVLSSIRRLVSEDKRPMQPSRMKLTGDRLVLTPALRVAEDPVAEEPLTEESRRNPEPLAGQPDGGPTPDVLDDHDEIEDLRETLDDRDEDDGQGTTSVAQPEMAADLAADPASDDLTDLHLFDIDLAKADHAAVAAEGKEDKGVEATEQDMSEEEEHVYGSKFEIPRGDFEQDDFEQDGLEQDDFEQDDDDEVPWPLDFDEAAVSEYGSDNETVQPVLDPKSIVSLRSKMDVADAEPESLDGDLVVPSRGGALSAKIAALETAISKIPDDWEPDQPGDDDYSGTEAPTIAWEDDVELDGNGAPVDDRATFAAEPDEPDEIEEALEEQAGAASPVQQQEQDQDAGGLAFGNDDQFLDEEALRDLVSEIVRAELQGALGERITRNVRKLVRREIHRALTAQELE